MAKGDFILKDFSKSIEKELKAEHAKAMKRAVKPLVKKIRENIDQEFEQFTGNLRRGVTVDVQPHNILIGMSLKKAPHALMMELGSYLSGDRKTTGEGSKPAGISSGTLVGKPYFLPAYQAVESQMIKLLSQEWF